VIETCTTFKIAHVIPTCEEVFWLSKINDLPAYTALRTSSYEVLRQLHNKHAFSLLADKLGFGAQHNILVDSEDGLREAIATVNDTTMYVAKPVFSRFASNTLISPTRKALSRIQPTKPVPWLIQKKAEGIEYCIYCLAQAGELLTHVTYIPQYRLGKNGASVYFEAVNMTDLENMARAFIKEVGFTGQISFDVIASEHQIVAIECNPRGTSGAHLLAQQPQMFSDSLLGGHPYRQPDQMTPVMLALPLLFSHPSILIPANRHAYSAAYDAMTKAGVPLWVQFLGLAEMLRTSLSKSVGLLQATTADIEWNGEEVTHGD
jgi:hypothetical protein